MNATVDQMVKQTRMAAGLGGVWAILNVEKIAAHVIRTDVEKNGAVVDLLENFEELLDDVVGNVAAEANVKFKYKHPDVFRGKAKKQTPQKLQLKWCDPWRS